MKMKQISQILGLVIWFATVHTSLGFYNPSTGKWLSRDPIGETGGANVSGFAGNSPVEAIDILGRDFIAVGSTLIKQHGLGNWPLHYEHFSLEYYEEACPCTEEGAKFDQKSVPTAAKRIDAVDGGVDLHTFGHYTTYHNPRTGHWTQWSYERISYINRGAAVDVPERMIVIYSDTPRKDAKAKWNSIITAADTYKYAENKYPLGKTLDKWPNSRYGYYGNNSNTLIYHLTSVIGRDPDVVGGRHPGNRQPVAVVSPGYTVEYDPNQN